MAFTRPHRTHPLPPWHGARPPGVPAQASGEAPFGAVPAGTMAALFGVFATGLFLNGDRPTELARFGAWGVGISIAAALLIDLKRGIHNLARTDVLAIVGLYFLTLFEFIFTQAEFDTLTGF